MAFKGRLIGCRFAKAANLFYDDEVGIWGARIGEMEITKVDDNWAEGTFNFTCSTPNSSKTIAVTDGFFRIAVPKKK